MVLSVCFWRGHVVGFHMVTFAITIESDTPVVQAMWDYCSLHNQHGIYMAHGRYLVVDGEYWVWRVEAEPSKYLDLLLLRWGEYLRVM
jgi:hypothetical protein